MMRRLRVDASIGLKTIADEISRQVAEGAIRQDVINAASSAVERNPGDPIMALFSYIRENVKYVPDPEGEGDNGLELLTAPWRMVADIADGDAVGDCDCMSIALASLYRAAGLDARVVLVDLEGTGYDHAYVEVYSQKTDTWITADIASLHVLGWVPNSVKQRLEVP